MDSTPRARRRSATASRRRAPSTTSGAAPAGAWRSPSAPCNAPLFARSSAGCSSWSPAASLSGTRSPGLEVFGEDLIRQQGGDEALDLVFHVRANEHVQIVEHRLGAELERLVEAIARVLAVAAAAVPLALRAAQRHVPVPVARRRPVRRVDEVRVAGRADVEIVLPAPGGRRQPRLEDAGLEPTIQCGPAALLRCLPLRHFACSIGGGPQDL